MSYDADNDYTLALESRAQWDQQAENEARRYAEEHPEHATCPKHPSRDVVDSRVSTLRHCAECIAAHGQNYVDRMIDNDRNWSTREVGDIRQKIGAGYTHPSERD